MVVLGSHVNLWETCLQLLEERGYSLRLDCDEDEMPMFWHAQKGEFNFLGNNPIELMGLVAIYDAIEPREATTHWWGRGKRKRVKGELVLSIYQRLLDECDAREKDARAWRSRPAWAATIRAEWENNEKNLKDTADALRIPVRILAPCLIEMGLIEDESKSPKNPTTRTKGNDKTPHQG